MSAPRITPTEKVATILYLIPDIEFSVQRLSYLPESFMSKIILIPPIHLIRLAHQAPRSGVFCPTALVIHLAYR